ncbi:MAG TPA: S8 family serine peptidase [Pyrinomonadaceae bacterium]
MRSRAGETAKRFLGLMFVLTLVCVSYGQAFGAARLSPALQNQLNGLANNASVGVVIISFNAPNGLTTSHLNVLRSVGITKGVTFQKLGMVGAVLTAGQIRALANNSSVRSIWSNDRQAYYMNQARMVAGVDNVRTDAGFTFRNGGSPVTGNGDFSVLLIDSGVDATHADLPYGTKIIQNTQRVVSTDAGNTGITVAGIPLNGFTPSVSLEGVPNTDNVGHGTHCAGIIGGLGSHSGGVYSGVAPGVKIVGSGGGAVILVLDALAGWEYGLSHQDIYKIRIISNSYGPLGGGQYDPEHPFMIAAKKAHDLNMSVVFAGGNDGAAKDTLSPYAQAPWVIGVAAGTKDGMLADFSSRGLPREERLSDGNPLNDNEAPTLTAPGNGRFFAGSLSRYGFTSDIVSVRASTNLTANGLNADAELPPGMIPFYTQISGTSMATPFTAGTIALMLDVDPTLTPDEIKQILIDTATRMPGYQDFEVGAGYINSYAAVDKAFNRSKAYSNFSNPTFNTVFGEERPAAQGFHIDFSPEVSGQNSTNATAFTVEPNMNVLDVFATVDNLVGAGTGNLVGIRITSPSGVNYSTAIEYPVIGSSAREITVQNPEAGTWHLEVRGARGLTAAPQASSPIQIASPGPVDGNVTQVKYILPVIADIQGHQQQTQIEAALKNRVIDTFADGTFRPDVTATREDLARSLVLNTPLRQSIASTPRFTDVSGEMARIAEAVTANGSTLRDYNFVPGGMMSANGNQFNPAASINRLDLAVALVRALGHDAEARALNGQPVMWNGSELSDDAQIPPALRGYVQIAINDGLFEAYPAQVVQTGPGQFQVLPGPRFEPATTVTRATLAVKLNQYRQLFVIGG